MNDNSTTNTAAQPDEAASDRTPIYNAVAKLRDAVTQLCGGDVATMEFFKQNARIIITGVAYIADTRDAVIKELFKEAHNKEVQLDTDSGADYKREYFNTWVAPDAAINSKTPVLAAALNEAPNDPTQNDASSEIVDENTNVVELKPAPHKYLVQHLDY